MASIFSKRGELWLGWIEHQNGSKIHPQINLNLVDNKQNRKIALEIKKKKEYELKHTEIFYVKKLKVAEAKETFLEIKKKKKKNTFLIYDYSLQKLNNYDEKFINEISKKDIDKIVEILKTEGKKEQSIITYLKHIKIFFDYCLKNKLVTSNPVIIPKATINNVVKVISDDEIKEILEYFRERNKKHYYLLELLNNTGLRVSELLSIKWEDINFNKKTIVIRNTKGNRDEEIILTDTAERILNEMPRVNERLFDYKSRQSLKGIKRELAKFGYSFHDFRRTFGTRCARILKPYELKKVMRHKDIRTTDKYYINIELDEIRSKINF
ncbi:MAG: tyrosine-type recombinase/integrase [Ignavibacteriae bacterium]|nr:tyrosine-type recombinase/integrase [Ignavibacteriota bacterium]